LRETARAATHIAKAESRSGRSNHFFRTVSLVKLAFPFSSISSTIFKSFSGIFVRMKANLFSAPEF
jgi:hypothetical protein